MITTITRTLHYVACTRCYKPLNEVEHEFESADDAVKAVYNAGWEADEEGQYCPDCWEAKGEDEVFDREMRMVGRAN